MDRQIIWMSLADGSWGGCEESALLIVNVNDLTESELESLSEVDTETEVYDILIGAVKRLDPA